MESSSSLNAIHNILQQVRATSVSLGHYQGHGITKLQLQRLDQLLQGLAGKSTLAVDDSSTIATEPVIYQLEIETPTVKLNLESAAKIQVFDRTNSSNLRLVYSHRPSEE